MAGITGSSDGIVGKLLGGSSGAGTGAHKPPTATRKPSSRLAANMRYAVTVDVIKDRAVPGNTVVAHSWSFTTRN